MLHLHEQVNNIELKMTRELNYLNETTTFTKDKLKKDKDFFGIDFVLQEK